MFSRGDTPWLYPDVLAVLQGLGASGIDLAVASRTPTPDVADAFIDKLQMRSHFCRRGAALRGRRLACSTLILALVEGAAPVSQPAANCLRGHTPHSPACSIQLIPAADGFDHHSAQKDRAHLPRIQRDTGHAYADMVGARSGR